MPYPTLAFPFLLLLTEYGFQTRKTAMRGLSGDGGRKLIYRLIGWLLLAWAANAWRSPCDLGLLAAGFVLGELTVTVLHRTIRDQVGRGLPHGGPVAHLILPLASIVFALMIYELHDRFQLCAFAIDRALPAALAILVPFTALWCWSTLMTVSLVDLVRPGQVRDDLTPALGGGELIGLLERLVVFGLVIGGVIGSLALIVAAKAAARFPQFKEEAFAEYFLIGTLSSVGLAALLGLLSSYLLHLL